MPAARALLAVLALSLLGCGEEKDTGRRGGIVSLAPSLTEIVFAVGKGDALAGVTTHCDYPEAAKGLPRVGGYGTPNVELVYSLKPDVVLVPEEGYLLGPVERLRALGVRVESVKVTRLADVEAACERVGALVGAADAGRELARSLRERRERVEKAVAGRKRERVLLFLDRDPLICAGPGTFADDMLRAAGAENAASGVRAAYAQIGREGLVAMRPNRVLDASMGDPEVVGAAARFVAITFWGRLFDEVGWHSGGLASGGHVYPPPEQWTRLELLDPDLYTRPGPRLIDGLENLAAILHPDAF